MYGKESVFKLETRVPETNKIHLYELWCVKVYGKICNKHFSSPLTEVQSEAKTHQIGIVLK